MTSVLPEPGTISLARGIPSPEMLPVHALAECAARAVERFGDVALNYGDPAGFAPLREWLAERHGVSPSRVFVTPGSLVALNLIVRRLLEDPGRVLVEAPTYDRMLHLLGLAGAEIAPVPHDGDGLDPDALSALLKAGRHPEFVYVLPTFHNPTGRTLTRTARERVADIAVEHDLVVVEDDPYGLLRLEGEPLPTLHALLTERGRGDLGIFLSSFSKSVAPGLRVGYAVVPEALAAGIAELATSLYVSPPLLAQAQLFEFLDTGLLDGHVQAVCALLRCPPRRAARGARGAARRVCPLDAPGGGLLPVA